MKVLIAYLHRSDSTKPGFQKSLRMLCVRDAYLHPGRLVGVIDHESSANIAHARNEVVRRFLAEREADWLLFLDDDMTFAEDLLDRLAEAADPDERPILGGLCFGMRPPKRPDGSFAHDPQLGYVPELFPTLYVATEDGVVNVADYPRSTVVRVSSTGAACLLVHRSVFTHDAWDTAHPFPWFRESTLNGGPVSEDQFFCLRAGALGFPVHVHTGAHTGHEKTLVCTERVADALRRIVNPAAPADERVAVIVPVYRRSGRAEQFMRSLTASTGLADAYAIVDSAESVDVVSEWADAGAAIVRSEQSGFAHKVNVGYKISSEPYLCIVGDDVRFHAGWWDEALETARKFGAGLVATNDLGNEWVMDGRHATHPVVARDYVDEFGASWDGPGVLASEAYRHCYVDNEWTAVAMERGRFAYAPGSVVEHLHPVWGKGEDDETYRHGQRFHKLDAETFERRLRKYAKAA